MQRNEARLCMQLARDTLASLMCFWATPRLLHHPGSSFLPSERPRSDAIYHTATLRLRRPVSDPKRL